MKVYIHLKPLGRQRKKLHKVPFEYERKPESVRELIEFTVEIMVAAFIERVEFSKTGNNPDAMEESEIEARAEMGKIAFGFVYGKTEIDMNQAKETALQAYEDGLVRIFIGDEETGTLEDEILINDGDELTFVKLSMLAGRMW